MISLVAQLFYKLPELHQICHLHLASLHKATKLLILILGFILQAFWPHPIYEAQREEPSMLLSHRALNMLTLQMCDGRLI